MRRIYCLVILLLACSSVLSNEAEQEAYDRLKQVTVTISGSPEHPDPVLVRVQELEHQGVLTDVAIMESFPVQITFTGPLYALNELRKIPRKRLIDNEVKTHNKAKH